MLSADFHAWAARHVSVFGFAAETVLEWAGIFAAEGYHAAELHAATDADGLRDVPGGYHYRADHLRALTAILRERRREKRAAVGPKLDAPACPDCHGSGWATVPDTRRGREGQDVAVSCSCPAGRLLESGLADYFRAKGKMLLSLAEYEAERPAWREERARLAEVAAARRAAEATAGGLDSVLGPILRKIKAQRKGG